MRTHRIIEAATFIIFMPFAMYLGDLAAFYVALAFFFLYEGLWAIRYRLDALLEVERLIHEANPTADVAVGRSLSR